MGGGRKLITLPSRQLNADRERKPYDASRRVVTECQPYCLPATLNKLLLNSLGEIMPSQAERVAAFANEPDRFCVS